MLSKKNQADALEYVDLTSGNKIDFKSIKDISLNDMLIN